MHPNIASTLKSVIALTAVCLWAAADAQAQPGQGFGGFQQFGGGQGSRRSSSSTSYPGNSEVGDAVISIDPETRSLIVIADERTREYISQVVSNLDRPKPQVLIKVVFMEVTHNNSSDIGIEGGWGKGIGNSATGAVANAFGMSGINNSATSNLLNVFGQPTSSFQPVPPGAGLYQIFAQDYQVTLRAIATAGRAKVLSRPSVIARNNQPATISVGQSVPLVTSSRFDQYGNAINQYNYTDLGIILRVTPFITSDGMVEMILSPETSEMVQDRSQWVPISSGVSAPVINQRSADTVVVTPDGQTVIIGGLMYDSKADSESKIPFLGDIPLLGNLFKRKIKSNTKTELLIFLTPHIVLSPTELASLAARERERSGARTTFTNEELNKFLENLPSDENSGKTFRPKNIGE
ncbi:MAG TPA: secretin N-terminal domain-containing protein [Verrucomicrobiae bacterium]